MSASTPVQGAAQSHAPGAELAAEAVELPGGDDRARAHARLCALELIQEELIEARVMVDRMFKAREAQDQRLARLAGVLWPLLDHDTTALCLWQDVMQLRRRLFACQCPLFLVAEQDG